MWALLQCVYLYCGKMTIETILNIQDPYVMLYQYCLTTQFSGADILLSVATLQKPN